MAGGLYQNKTLEDLCLNFSSIGNDGCRAIASSLAACGLKHLDQGHCGIGNDGAIALADGIGKSKSLETLVMDGNSIGDAGCQALAAALGRTSTLCVLSLQQNFRITATGATALEEALRHANLSLEALRLNDNDGVNQDHRDRIEYRHIRTASLWCLVGQP